MAADTDEFHEPYYASLIELSRTRTDYRKYMTLLDTAMMAGDDHACYALSSMYLHGNVFEGVDWKVDAKHGLRLLRRASRSVHLAMTELASFYETGEFGLRPNAKKAFELFSRAVKFGSVSSRFHLGRCYYFGVGTKVDRRRGRALFKVAAELGFPVPDVALEK
jgi:uncharacterized protein